MSLDRERHRLLEDHRRKKNWKRWGPYLADRQWGTVREDYSADGSVWGYFSHDLARRRAFRWGEDGLFGWTDRQCRLCFSVALWNGHDPILKERLFGLTGPEGNHGEDVKECYYHLEATPTHSYNRVLYKYPQVAFPYEELVQENSRRGRLDREYELLDTGIFDHNRYFDVFFEYAKAAPDDTLIEITISNRASKAATLHLLPTLWFRNTWSWGRSGEGYTNRPNLFATIAGRIQADHPTLGSFTLLGETPRGLQAPALIFTENETNHDLPLASGELGPFCKDAFHRFIVNGDHAAVHPGRFGTKGAFYSILEFAPLETRVIRLRLLPTIAAEKISADVGRDFGRTMAARRRECAAFYRSIVPPDLDPRERDVLVQVYAGLLWSKQFYHFSVAEWLEGDPTQPPPPPERRNSRNADWVHLYNRDIISMPDKWEYPWYAAWDSAFHMIAFARIDPLFAKDQLLIFLREWYMHPNGQIPAQEFDFSQVNPPVHAWTCWRVYKMTAPRGYRDRDFLKKAFHKLMVNFTWWVNRKDLHGKNLFSGGFLGLDNIGVFDRGAPMPKGGHLEQADATAWMAFYCSTMLSIALELAEEDSTYEDVASKFFEHFMTIMDSINHFGGRGLWDDVDGFYYDQLFIEETSIPLRIRSLVGLIPLLAIGTLDERSLSKLPNFRRRFEWFLRERPSLAKHIDRRRDDSPRDDHDDGRSPPPGDQYLLAVPYGNRLKQMLRIMFDEKEFLAPHGIRSLSKIHAQQPFVLRIDSEEFSVDYAPGDSTTAHFGGNSNWRGPIWFPINYLIVEALEKLHHFYGDSLMVEYPTGSGRSLTLGQISRDIAQRLTKLFLPDEHGHRPCHGGDVRYRDDPFFRDLILFYEHFHGDSGAGVGASHQTGWTALVAGCFEKLR